MSEEVILYTLVAKKGRVFSEREEPLVGSNFLEFKRKILLVREAPKGGGGDCFWRGKSR